METKARDSYLYARRELTGYTAVKALAFARTDTHTRYPLSEGSTRGWQGCSDGGVRFVERLGAAGLRAAGFADEILDSLHHKGWYTDDDGSREVLRGAVLQMAAKDRKERYLAAYADSCNPGAYIVDTSEIFDDKDDAARAADSFAERTAEKERDYQSAWRKGQDYRDALEEAASAKTEIRALLADLRTAKASTNVQALPPSICKVMRAKVRDLRASARAARERAAEILDSVESYWSSDLRSAFNDGADATVV